MNGRLYRLTPAGGKPNHYTDSYASVLAVLGEDWRSVLDDHLTVGGRAEGPDGTIVERIA